MYRIIFLLMVISGFSLTVTAQVEVVRSKKNIEVSKAAVVCAHPLASKIGIDVLRAGGNAFDAGIAVQLALAVVYPNAGNLGGGGFMVARCSNGTNWCLDYREVAPEHAYRDMYVNADGQAISELSQQGPLASGVPGTVAGIFKMHQKAKLPFSTLIQPAIELARNGFALTQRQARELNANKAIFLKNNKHPIAFVKDSAWKEGDLLMQPELAQTLERIRDQGEAGFYEGLTASCIVQEMQRNKGLITLNDLKQYKARERNAMEFDFEGHHFITMPLPSSGGIILNQLFTMTSQHGVDKMSYFSPESVQLMIEAMRRSFADRAGCLGDPDFIQVPVDSLLSSPYLKRRMQDYIPMQAGHSKNLKAGFPCEHEETTHISILDESGNAVSITTTLNDSYGSKTVVAGAGFILNNEMDDFSIKAGVPNMYGAIGNKANEIAPGKKMLSSMTPVIVTRNGQVTYVIGSPGGTTIPTNIFQTLLTLIHFKQVPDMAVNQPKFHFQWLPDSVYVEKDFPDVVRNSLSAMGYTILERGPIGRTELIAVKYGRRKKIIAVADKRGDDAAAGY